MYCELRINQHFIFVTALSVYIKVSYNPPSDIPFPSPPYFHPATSVTLTCHAYGASQSVTYHWSSTSDHYPTQSQSVSIGKLTSGYAGVYTCTVTDSEENTGSNSTEIKLKGKVFLL